MNSDHILFLYFFSHLNWLHEGLLCGPISCENESKTEKERERDSQNDVPTFI